MYIAEPGTMEHNRLECLLDSIQRFRDQVDELLQQQHDLCRESIGRMVVLADLPTSISSVKRRKGLTRYFQSNKAEEHCRNAAGKENILVGGSDAFQRSCTKGPAKSSRRRRKPLVDSQAINRIVDGADLDEAVALQHQQTGNEGLVHSVEGNKSGHKVLVHSEEGYKRGNEELAHSMEGNKSGHKVLVHSEEGYKRGNEELAHSMERNKRGNEGNKSTSLAGRGNEELIRSIEGKRSMPTSVSPLHSIVAGGPGAVRDAEESLPDLEKPRTSSVSTRGRLPQVKTEVSPDIDAPRLTRHRARILQNAGANVTISRGEPPLKKRRGRKGKVNSSFSPPTAEEDETPGKMQTACAQAAMEQQSRDESASQNPPSLKKRYTRASSRSPAETNGKVGKSGATGEEQEVRTGKVNSSDSPATAEEDETPGKMQTIAAQATMEQQSRDEPAFQKPPSLTKRTTRASSHSPAETNGKVGKNGANGEEHETPGIHVCTGKVNSSDSPATAEEDETPGKMQTIAAQAAMEQQSRDEPAFQKPPSLTKRNTRASSRSPAETNGKVGKNGATGEEHETPGIHVCTGKVNSSDSPATAEEDETPAKMQTPVAQAIEQQSRDEPASQKPPSFKKKTTRATSCSPAETNGKVGKNGAAGEEQEVKAVKGESWPPKISLTAGGEGQEEDVEVRKGKVNSSDSPATAEEKQRGREVNFSDSPAIAEDDRTPGKMQTTFAQAAMEQQSRDEPASQKPPSLKRRTTRASSRSPAETNGKVGKNGATDEQQEVKAVRGEKRPPKMSLTAGEKGEEEDIEEGRPSKKSRTSLKSTRLNSDSQAEANAVELGNLEDAKANAHSSAEDLNWREGSATKRSRERNGNASARAPPAPVDIDGNVGKFETVGMNQDEGFHRTAAADQLGNTFPPLEVRDGMESPQASMIMPPSQNGDESELRINCGSAKTSAVDLADAVLDNAFSEDRGHVLDCTDSSSECLASAEEPPESHLKEGAYWGFRRTTLLLSPALKCRFVEREAQVIVDLKPADTSSISEVTAEEQMEEENPSRPLREGHSRRVSHPSVKTDADPGSSPRTVPCSVGEHFLAVELDIKESRIDAIVVETTDSQLPAVREASEWMEFTKDEIPLLEVSIAPGDRDGDVLHQGEVHSGPGKEVEHPESVDVSEGRILLGQPPQTQITHRNCAGTPIRREARLTELVTPPEVHVEELVYEESDEVRREKRLTLLLTAPEVHGEELIDTEAGAVVPYSQLKSNEGNHVLESFAVNDMQGGLYSQSISDALDHDNRREEELKVILPLAVDVNPSVQQEGRNETTGSLENQQINVSLVRPSVQKWHRSRLLEIGELATALSKFGRTNPGPVNDHHSADNVCFQRRMDPSCELRGDGKEVGTIVTPLEQASELSPVSGRSHMEGIVPIEYAPPTTSAQNSSELRLSKAMSTKQAGLSWMVADGGEDDKCQSRIMEPECLHDAQEGPCAGTEIEEKGQPQWASKLNLLDRGANKPRPFSMDESSTLSFQNKKATDLQLQLWKRGGIQGTGLTACHGPSSSEPAGRNYKLDTIDEVNRSVVVRECGGDGAVSSSSLPIANWCSGIVCNISGESSESGTIMIERSVPASDVSDGLEAREVAAVDSEEDRKSDQEGKTMRPSLLLIKDQDQDQSTQDSVSALENLGAVECSQGNICEVSSERECRLSEQLLSHEELHIRKPIPFSRVEGDLVVSSLLHKPEDCAIPAVDPFCNPVGPVATLRQAVSSNIVNAQKPYSNLISSMKSFVPVVQQPPPSFMPDGKRAVKVKALMVAEAAKRAKEKGRLKDRLRKLREDSASSGKEETVEAGISLKECVGGSKLDGGESSCGSQLSPRKKVPLSSNSRTLFSPEAKSKHAANLEIEKKVKKNQAELKRMEEERKCKLLAARQLKEQLVQKKMEKRQEVLKQKKEQNRLVAEQEDKAQKHRASEEAEREKKALEEKFKSKQCSPRSREKENLQGEELKVKGAGGLQTGQGRPGHTPGRIRSNLLGLGILPLRSAARVPVFSHDKRARAIVAAAIQKKGRHPSSSSSSPKLASNAEHVRLSSLNAECATAEGVPVNSTHAFSFDNRPADVQQRGSGYSVSCIRTPCSTAVEKEEELGPTSYEISPYRGSSSDEEDDDVKEQPPKHIPFWARKENLIPQLLKQPALDPDEIFSGRKTCSLKDVFGKTGSEKVQDFGKRSGSGDWFKDRVSWKEELNYKIHMGYMPDTYS